MKPSIIQAGPEHIEQLVPLFNAYREFYRQTTDLEGARQFLTDRFDREESVIFLAMLGEKEKSTELGFIQLYPSFSSAAMRRVWILNDLFVAPAYRKQGVARLLMEAAHDLARATGAARLSLATARDNTAAKSLYEALGYKLDITFDRYDLSVQGDIKR